MLDLAQSYAGKARNDASRDKGLGDYYAGGGSSGGGSCPASAAEKTSGTMYVWAASDAEADCTE